MNTNDYILGIDVWEGSLEIDEAILLANKIKFLLVRINNMNGGHHKDSGFDKQWSEAINFIRIPYFVYNPWVDGLTNANYLISILPEGVKTIAVDIEVRKDGYSSSIYALQVDKCIKYWMSQGITVLVYTGGWFLSYLSYWPSYVEYWWARYPYTLYPKEPKNITWDQLRQLIETVSWSPNCIGPCSLWQCSGDRLILPGTLRTMDINIFYGNEIGMIQKYNIPAIQQPQSGSPVDTGDGGNEVQPIELVVQKACNVRPLPSTSNTPSRLRSVGDIVRVDDLHVTNWEEVWAHDKDGWSAMVYYGTVFMK